MTGNLPFEPAPEDLRRVAEHLDGSAEPLSPEQARLAEEVRQDLTWLAAQPRPPVPTGVLERVGATVNAELRRRRQHRQRRIIFVPAAIAAAVAVAILLLTLLGGPPAAPDPTRPGPMAVDDPIQRELVEAELASLVDEDAFHLVAQLALAAPEDLVLQLPETEEDDASALPTSTLPVY